MCILNPSKLAVTMHALHSFAHRAPPATRTRVRWQPYSRSPAPYLITPISSNSNSLLIRDSSSKNKYAIGLVDQAVKSLCEIWSSQDIPSVFLSSSRTVVPIHETTEQKQLKPCRNTQLPSPISPSAPSPSISPVPPSLTPALQLTLSDQDTRMGSDSCNNLVPIKGFVHEVLRRSRTSGCVLQTALCYLEAIRSKIPEIARQENAGIQAEDSPERITMATEAELDLHHHTGSSLSWDSIINTEKYQDEDVMATVRVHDDDLDICHSIRSCLPQVPDPGPKLQPSNGQTSCSTSPLPSPLLCPRRAFLASLILASKFTQDKCYSNRAWAKLSGLPPREIGRCERALGEALEWRLWVGKRPVTAQTLSPTVNRPVVRSQSESSLLQSASSRTTFLVWNEKSTPSAVYSSPSRSISRGGLRRCATLPAEAFTAPISEHTSCDKTTGGTIITSSDLDMSDQTPSFPSSITPTLVSSCAKGMMNSSPSPPTPGLSYSPSSTESSSGDRTIQMSTFPDDSMTPFSSCYRGILNSGMCPWLDNPDGQESFPVIRHCQPTNLHPVFDHSDLVLSGFRGDGPSPCKTPVPFASDPHSQAAAGTSLMC